MLDEKVQVPAGIVVPEQVIAVSILQVATGIRAATAVDPQPPGAGDVQRKIVHVPGRQAASGVRRHVDTGRRGTVVTVIILRFIKSYMQCVASCRVVAVTRHPNVIPATRNIVLDEKVRVPAGVVVPVQAIAVDILQVPNRIRAAAAVNPQSSRAGDVEPEIVHIVGGQRAIGVRRHVDTGRGRTVVTVVVLGKPYMQRVGSRGA